MNAKEIFQSKGEVALRNTESWWVDSAHVGGRFEIRVAHPLPALRRALPEHLPVLYVLDGDLFFGMATELTRLQAMLFGELPPMRVIGIGYGTNDARTQGETRNRDFTPSSDARFEAMGRQMDPDWQPMLPDGRRMGGAARFLDFIEQELQPFVDRRWPRADAPTMLFGSSMGGLLATWALLHRTELFDRYVIASPALWWHDERVFEAEEHVASRNEDLSARAFLGVGALEEGSGIPGLDAWKMVTNPRRLAERLLSRRYPSLELELQVIDGESHTSVVPVALTRGLRFVSAPPKSPR